MEHQPVYVLHLESDLNRVFADSVAGLAATELRIVADRILDGRLGPIDIVDAGRTTLLRFPSEASPERLATTIGQLSSAAALFREHGDHDRPTTTLLEPLPTAERLVYGTELATTQRYRGKTNERLTRLMLNLALATAGVDPGRPTDSSATVLDPFCGRGTTLNWALAYGLDVIGIEIDRSSLDQHRIFIEGWAKRRRLPHRATAHRAGNAEHRWLTMRVAPDRATHKAGGGQSIQTYLADGAADEVALARGSVDAIVTDLPYGVQHGGSRRRADGAEPDDPTALLERGLAIWYRWLRPGGALCLAWNLKRTSRDEVTAAAKEAGFDPIVARGGFSMRHRVDATIERDVLVAHRRH